MGIKTLITLKTDEDFMNLIPPKRKVDFEILEKKIIEEGCLEPIKVWNGFILDGHSRYRICQKHKIPYEIKMHEFDSKTDACIWLAHYQLKCNNLTEEYSRYLVGKVYELERSKYSDVKPPAKNQYSASLDEDDIPTAIEFSNSINYVSARQTATVIGDIYHLSYGTVQKYSYYARAIDILRSKEPGLVPKIMSGRTKISHNALMDLTRMSKEELRLLNERLNKKKTLGHYSHTREALKENSAGAPKGTTQVSSIKDMPNYDPDASVVELSLTIPTWGASIDRVIKVTDFTVVSEEAKNRLIGALASLEMKIADLIANAEEE